ncbi:MAG: rod shape-determining protein [Coriobacteriales bacterium]|nr:rod shape-determining protein [Coriobacteriales bacterium]MBQ6586433.1 rod shape-determining protein [Coriobacteriales bacterium]
MAIDLGTANTLVLVRGQGLVLNEPSVVAIEQQEKRVLAVGLDAKDLLGRTPGNIVALRPLRDGVIADYDVTEAMLRYFINKALPRKYPWQSKPRIVICVPTGATSVERKAVYEACIDAGARQAFLIEEPMAAAIGAGLPVEEPTGSMVVDIGGGTSEVAVISFGGIVASTPVRVAGNAFDAAIQEYAKEAYNLVIGERTAEEIKIKIGSAAPLLEELDAEVCGRDNLTGSPRTIRFESEEIRDALKPCVDEIVKGVKATLRETPADLSADLMEYGILLTGGGGLLRGLDERIMAETGVPVYVSPTALTNVVEGCAKVLEVPGALTQPYLQNR